MTDKYILNQDKVFEFVRSREPEATTIQDVMDEFGSEYRATADIMKRMTEGARPLLERDRDGRTWCYHVRTKEPVDPNTLLDEIIEKCNQPEYEDDTRVQSFLKMIVEREGGLMNDTYTTKGGKEKKNSGYSYAFRNFIDIASEFNLI